MTNQTSDSTGDPGRLGLTHRSVGEEMQDQCLHLASNGDDEAIVAAIDGHPRPTPSLPIYSSPSPDSGCFSVGQNCLLLVGGLGGYSGEGVMTLPISSLYEGRSAGTIFHEQAHLNSWKW